MEIKTVGIVGYGAFGALLHTLLGRFASDVVVRIHSRDKKPDGKTFYSLAETAKSDALVLAVPISEFEEVLKKVLPLIRTDTVLVDVATVKVHTLNLLKKLAKGRRYISTHPVWGPESYEKRATRLIFSRNLRRAAATSPRTPCGDPRATRNAPATCGAFELWSLLTRFRKANTNSSAVR